MFTAVHEQIVFGTSHRLGEPARSQLLRFKSSANRPIRMMTPGLKFPPWRSKVNKSSRSGTQLRVSDAVAHIENPYVRDGAGPLGDPRWKGREGS